MHMIVGKKHECALCPAPVQAKIRVMGTCKDENNCGCVTLALCAPCAYAVGMGALGDEYALGMLTDDSPIQSWDALVQAVA